MENKDKLSIDTHSYQEYDSHITKSLTKGNFNVNT